MTAPSSIWLIGHCPHCLAGPGEPCKEAGEPMKAIHGSRTAAAWLEGQLEKFAPDDFYPDHMALDRVALAFRFASRYTRENGIQTNKE